MPRPCSRIISAWLLAALLGGCAMLGRPVAKIEEPAGPPPPTAEELYARAACQDDPARGMALARSLLANDPDNVATQLLHAYMIERTGRPVHAWEIYKSLADGNYGKSTSLTCGGRLVYGGAVSDVARFRSLWLAEQLETRGVVLAPEAPAATEVPPPPPEMTQQMVILPPPFAAVNHKGTPDAAPSVPVEKAATATSPAPATGVFVHLASYKGPKALDRGWREISNRHKDALGAYQKATERAVLAKTGGSVLRLGVRAADQKTARALCKALKAGRQYCAILK